ncbi:MAG: hypothetical protein JRJ87_25565, partial [Deltaproteobacteria bacterium]|nr:hypothetical protein [Deltaproteobacteria bacterium]
MPDCTNLECGPDLNNCPGENCGTCDAGYTCNNGTCELGGAIPGDLCPNGDSDCPVEFPTCLGSGDLTYCSKACTGPADISCGAGNCCLDLSGGDFFCWDPSYCPGDSGPGDPCPFTGDVNDDADQCEAGLDCLGIAASDTNGTCPGGADSECTDISESWNPSCVTGNCGASFCAAECVAGACEAGFVPQDIPDLGCRCVPESDSECTDPVNNVGCDANQTCAPAGGASLVCIDAGSVPLMDDCTDNPCVEGHVCMALGTVDRCYKLCDADANTGCPGTGDWYCGGWIDVDRWGFCVPNDLCTMGGTECTNIDDGLGCIIWSDACDEFRCLFTSGDAEGVACSYSNSCLDGLFCAGTPGVCTDVCL